MEEAKKNCKNDDLLLSSLNQRVKRVNTAHAELRWDNEENGK